MKRKRFATLTINRAYSYARKRGLHFAVMIMPRGHNTKCGYCRRGVIMRWSMGLEPEILDCRVCGTETTVEGYAQFYGKPVKRT